MNTCKICGSFAINHHLHGRDGTEPKLCDVCYWREKFNVLAADRTRYFAIEIDEIVAMCDCPERVAIDLLSSAVLYATGQCGLESFATSVAHLRLNIVGDYEDICSMLSGWLDQANEAMILEFNRTEQRLNETNSARNS